jgi:hypothetical protein
MTPQEENIRLQQEVNEQLMAYNDAQRAASKETQKRAETEAKVEQVTGLVIQTFEKLYNANLKYQLSIAKGSKGAATFNDSLDAMSDATQAAAVALSLLVPGGALVKGVVAGLTFLATTAIRTANEWQKLSNEQADATYKAFQAFSKAGATGADGLNGFFNDVNRMRLNVHQLDAMAQAMTSNAQAMSAMGGTVYKARGQFADLVAGMADFEKGMLNLGLSYDEQAEAALGFMQLQSNLTQGQQRDYGKLSVAARKYIEEQEILTRVTGFSRKQQEAAQEKYMAQQRYGAKIQELMDEGTDESRKKAELLQKGMARAAAQGEMFAQAYADQTTGMLTTDAAVRGNQATQGKQLEQINAVLEGRITNEEELNAAHQDTIATAKEFGKSMNKVYQMGGEDMMLPFKELQEISKAANQNFAEQMKDAKTQVEMLAGTINGADEQLNRFTNLVMAQNNKMSKDQAALNGQFTTGVAGAGFMDKFMKSMLELSDWIMKVCNVLKPLSEGLGNFFFGAVSSVGKLLKGDLTGAIIELGSGADSLTKGFFESNRLFGEAIWNTMKTFGQGLIKSIQDITGPLGPVFENIGKVMSGFGDSVKTGLTKFSDALVNMVADLWKKISAMIPDLSSVTGAAGEMMAKYASGADNYFSSKFGSSAPTSGRSASAGSASAGGGTPTQSGGGTSAARPNTTTAPGGAGKRSAAPTQSSSTAGGGRGAVNPELVVASNESDVNESNKLNVEKLLDYIGKKESRGQYDMLVGNKQYSPLTSMTVAEVMDFQKNMISGQGPTGKHETTAVGKYQIIKGTLQGLIKNGDIAPGDIFNSSTQDRAAIALLKEKGMDSYVSGKMSKDEFADRVARVWASMPLAGGKGAYDGVGSNRAIGSREDFMAAFARDGGIFDGPKSGYAATLHGMEAVIPLKDGAVPVSMSQEFNMTATNLGELVDIMKNNIGMQSSMLAVMEEIRRAQTTTADNTGKMVAMAA